MAYIELKNVSKYYLHSAKENVALNDLSLSIEEGEFISIVGRSGSGKSTLLGLISGLIQPSIGDVSIQGERLWALNEEERAELRRRMMGQVFQDYKLIDYLDVKNNIRLPLVLDHQDMEESYLDYLIQRLQLENIADKFPPQLSGGEQQRVAIARALAVRPRILLADEPTGNLDLLVANEILSLLQHFSREMGLTTILVTHDPHIAATADRFITLEQGRMIVEEEKENLL